MFAPDKSVRQEAGSRFETTPRILFLDMNAFYASVEQQTRPELRDKPIAVVNVQSENTTIIAASYEAKAFGVKTGLIVKDARVLCPQLQIIPARHSLYIDFHAGILEALTEHFFSIKPLSIDEMACRLSQAQARSEIISTVVSDVKETIQRRLGEKMRCSIGVAPNVFLAKVAADMKKPDGFVLFGEGYPEQLKQLKLSDLPGIGERMHVRLKEVGVTTVAELLEKSKEELREIWRNVMGARFYDMLRGSLEFDYGSGVGSGEKRSIFKSNTLAPGFRDLEGATTIIKLIISDSLGKLRAKSLCAEELEVFVGFYGENEPYFADKVSLGISANDDLTWNRELQPILEKLRARKDVPRWVGVRFVKLEAYDRRMPTLFDEELSIRRDISNLVDTAQGKFGKKALQFGSTAFTEATLPQRISFGPPDLSGRKNAKKK